MMSNISMVEANLPPGFRFHPRDEELVCDYLMKKIIHSNSDSLLFIEVDLNKCEPWDIPETACVGGKEWYFYSQRDRKYATGLRTNRATASGYWKATGKDRAVLRKGVLVGMRKTLVFYKGRAPKGTKADWVMHEFRLHAPPRFTPHKEDWVLCRVFCKNKEVVAKPIGGSCYDDTGSSSLPPLMDSYISFDQTQPNLLEDDDDDDEYEQVPCFSFFSPAQTNPISPPMNINQIDHYTNIIPTKNITATSSFGQLPINTTSTCRNLDNDFSSDKEAIEAFLNQITKMNSDPNHIHGSPSLGEASSESYLSEVGISNPWTNHRY